MRVALGHVAHTFMLLRPALAALDHVYRFAAAAGEHYAAFDRPLIVELRKIRGSVLLTGVDLAAPLVSYSVLLGRVSNRIRAVGGRSSRWRATVSGGGLIRCCTCVAWGTTARR